MLYKARETIFIILSIVIIFFGGYSSIISEVKHASFHWIGIKVLTPKQILQILPVALAEVKAGWTSENLLN